jgi:hypothetical protein
MSNDNQADVLKLATTSVPTAELRTRLNSIYGLPRPRLPLMSQREHLDHLWDLKEKAILDGKTAVEVPQEWLNELISIDKSVHPS